MKICIIGAGAIGGLMAVRFATAGNDVSVIDQGLHLKAIQENGLTLQEADGTRNTVQVNAVSEMSELPLQDLIVLAVKAHFLDQIAREVESICGPDTMILPIQNGLPWWYFHKLGGEFDGKRLHSLDPSGVLGKHIDANRIIGCVVYPASGIIEPGVIEHVEGDRFPIGELDGSHTDRIDKLFKLFTESGFRSRILDDIRSEIWLKVWGNMSFNPISALTHSTLVNICQFKETRELAATMMREAQDVAEAIGATFRHTIEKRIDGAESVGSHKTSMLQDVEQGRSLETEAIIGAIIEIAVWVDKPVPSISAINACVKLLNREMLMENAGIKFVDIK